MMVVKVIQNTQTSNLVISEESNEQICNISNKKLQANRHTAYRIENANDIIIDSIDQSKCPNQSKEGKEDTKHVITKEKAEVNAGRVMSTPIQKTEYPILYEFFDQCFNQCRFDTADDCKSVGMAIKNTFGDDGYGLFKYYPNKS